MGFILSTSWNAYRHTDAKGMLFEIKEAGFAEVELSFNLTCTMVGSIEKMVKEGSIRVASLHNFCPFPDNLQREVALPDYYSLASPDAGERSLALQYTKRTIDTAQRLNARAVILHTGRVEIPDKTRDLISLYEQGLFCSAEFAQVKKTAISDRQNKNQPYFDNALKSLDELVPYSARSGISLGVENRFYYREIPSLKELGIILNKFRGSSIFYWHDVGHALIMEKLGFVEPDGYLKSYAQAMLGIHLHNVLGLTDHQVPQRGEFDFAKLKPVLQNKTLKVIEAHHPATSQDLKEAKAFLEETLGRDD